MQLVNESERKKRRLIKNSGSEQFLNFGEEKIEQADKRQKIEFELVLFSKIDVFMVSANKKLL